MHRREHIQEIQKEAKLVVSMDAEYTIEFFRPSFDLKFTLGDEFHNVKYASVSIKEIVLHCATGFDNHGVYQILCKNRFTQVYENNAVKNKYVTLAILQLDEYYWADERLFHINSEPLSVSITQGKIEFEVKNLLEDADFSFENVKRAFMRVGLKKSKKT